VPQPTALPRAPELSGITTLILFSLFQKFCPFDRGSLIAAIEEARSIPDYSVYFGEFQHVKFTFFCYGHRLVANKTQIFTAGINKEINHTQPSFSDNLTLRINLSLSNPP
jgi:hypothetical protein